MKLRVAKQFLRLLRYFQDRNLQCSFCSLVDIGLPFLPCASQSCHFCTQCCYSYILLKETKRFVHKNSFTENLPVQSCPIFLPHNPYSVAKYTQLHLKLVKPSRVLKDLRTKSGNTTQDRSVELRKPVLVFMSFPIFHGRTCLFVFTFLILSQSPSSSERGMTLQG